MEELRQQEIVTAPVACIQRHLPALQDAYCKHRAAHPQSDETLTAALASVLNQSEYDEVLAFLTGNLDDAYPHSKGKDFLRGLLADLEHLGQALQYADALAQRDPGGAATLAMVFAMDKPLASIYGRLDPTGADTLAWRVTQAVVQRSAKARTARGRRRLLARAARHFWQLSVSKMEDPFAEQTMLVMSANGHDDMVIVMKWCEAVYQRLNIAIEQVASGSTVVVPGSTNLD
jgi:hypothetical protein